jgi:5-formyltetrahydrofolate cyclo-ligase
MLKAEARQMFRRKRTEITSAQQVKWDDLVLIHFQKLDLPYLQDVLSFHPIEKHNEINTFIISGYLRFRYPGLRVSYPRSNLDKHTMEAVFNEHEEFANNKYGIPEPVEGMVIPPEELDMVIIPMLGFDRAGHRVGYGKGFYDRYLASCREDCMKVGLCYFDPVDRLDDASEFDVPLDFCITPERIYVF